MSAFDAIDQADATSSNGSRRPYFEEGLYICQVDRIRFLETRNKGDAIIVEMTPLQSNNPDVPVGITRAWYCSLTSDLGPLNFKRFLAAAYGCDPESEEANVRITSAVARDACGETQPVSGAWVRLECSTITTKAGTPFTVHTYYPISDEEAANVQAQLAG